MEDLFIPARERSPEVDFRFRENHLALRGEAYPEDAAAFFGPVLKELMAYCESIEGQELLVEFQLAYFNTSSAKALMNIIHVPNTAFSCERIQTSNPTSIYSPTKGTKHTEANPQITTF